MRLFGVLLVAIFLFQCTEEPPEEPYQGTAEDSAAIRSLIGEIDTVWLSATIFDEEKKESDTLTFGAFDWDTVVNVNDPLWKPDKEAITESVRIKVHPKKFGRKVVDCTPETTLVFGIDTTCTVYLDYSFEGYVLLEIDELCSLFYRRDTAGDTFLVDLDTFVFVTVTEDFDKKLRGSSRQAIHFDKKDGVWQLERMSGITEYTPVIDSALPISKLIIKTALTSDTIYERQDPTLTPPRLGMNQLFLLDSLVTVSVDEEVTFEFITGIGMALSIDPLFWRIYIHLGTERILDTAITKGYIEGNLSATFKHTFTDTGIKVLTFEALDANVGYYVGLAQEPNYGHFSTIWRVPIRVK
ncbi:MAG TPA: hypothetical protein EYP58_03295 [bacterium (Candidatus Stahlbacteria)]|nr:hypothetical protein [Candidatus Stahlbacteria bacterium]